MDPLRAIKQHHLKTRGTLRKIETLYGFDVFHYAKPTARQWITITDAVTRAGQITQRMYSVIFIQMAMNKDGEPLFDPELETQVLEHIDMVEMQRIVREGGWIDVLFNREPDDDDDEAVPVEGSVDEAKK